MSDDLMAAPLEPGSYASQSTPATPSSAPIVDDDIPCRKCSYNLRTLPTNGNCPECGTPVGVSIYGNLLRFSDPAWVGKLADGARYILVGIFMIVVAVIVGMIMGAVLGATGVAHVATVQVLVQLISLCGGIFSLIGSWFITEPDPSGIGEDEYGTARKVIRVTLLIQLASFPLNFASQRTVLPPAQRQLIVAISGLMSIAGVVGLIAQLQYFGKLAGRIPDQGLASRANFLKVALSTCYGFLILIGIVAGLMVFARGVAAPNSGIMIGFGCGAGIFGLASLVFGIMYLFMIEKFRGRFREQAVLAQQSWAAHPHGGDLG